MKIIQAFETLGLSETATEAEVKSAFRNLAKKYHPDVNNDSNARANFELITQAHDVILSYFTFVNSNEYKDHVEKKVRRTTRVKNVIKNKVAHKEFLKAKLLFEIAEFRSSYEFKISQLLSVFSCVLAFFMILDFYVYRTQNYEPIQTITFPQSFTTMQLSNFDDFTVEIQNRNIAISPVSVDGLLQVKYVKVTNSKWFKQVIDIRYIQNGKEKVVDYNNLYNDAIYIIILLLIGGMCMFFYTKRNALYYFMIRYYALYVLPLLIVYVLLGEARILRLIGLL